MIRIGLIVLAIFCLVLIGLWLTGKEVRVISTEVEISARPEVVWAVLTDIPFWEQWSPIIKGSAGSAALGSKLTITMVSEEGKEGKPGPKYEPVITALDAPQNLTWKATMGPGFVFTNGKVLKLEAIESGTRLIHQETFSGMMTPLMWGSVQKNVPGMLDSMNKALKELVEKNREDTSL